MKKVLFLSFFLLVAIPFAHAATTPNTADGTVPPGGACTTDNNCQDLSATQTYGCYNGTCTPNGTAITPNTANGTVPPGGACTTDNNCQDPAGGPTYGCYPEGNGTCTPNGDAPATSTAVAGPSSGNTGNFVPLTNLPVLNNLTTAPSIPAFLNSIYIYCVGIAGVLAVLQLIHAGILYMGGDSVTETKQARSLIASSLLGLALVLSPTIVFGIINPKILNLNVGFDKIALPGATTTAAPTLSPNQCIDIDYPGQWAAVPSGKQCGDSLKGTINADNVCCTGTQPTGDVCCAQNKISGTSW